MQLHISHILEIKLKITTLVYRANENFKIFRKIRL